MQSVVYFHVSMNMFSFLSVGGIRLVNVCISISLAPDRRRKTIKRYVRCVRSIRHAFPVRQALRPPLCVCVCARARCGRRSVYPRFSFSCNITENRALRKRLRVANEARKKNNTLYTVNEEWNRNAESSAVGWREGDERNSGERLCVRTSGKVCVR